MLIDRAAGRGPTRRGFLLTAMGSAFMFGFARQGNAAQVYPQAAGNLPAGGAFEPTIWCSIAPDGWVNVNVIRAEMGQHVGTALARIIADEMEADWNKVRITYVDTDPKWGLMITGGSWSVWLTWDRSPDCVCSPPENKRPSASRRRVSCVVGRA